MHNINLAAVYHVAHDEYRYCNSDSSVTIMLRTAINDWYSIYMHISPIYGGELLTKKSKKIKMENIAKDEMFSYYQANFIPEDPRFKYLFELNAGGTSFFYTPDGVKSQFELINVEGIQGFTYSYAYPADAKPEWANGCIAYQIFPDRFCRSGKSEKNMEKWNSTNITSDKFFGGNLAGMISKVPYLKRLGVQMVYLTPIFESDTAHRYNTYNYYKIDPMLGTEDELKEFVHSLHKNGIKLMLDGVFNHCGQKFPPFMDAIEKGKESPYYDWFFFGAREAPECGYSCFAYEKYMPKLNLKNKEAAEYFANVGKYWIEKCDIDGWRMDVSPEVYPDFWRYFRKEIKGIKDNVLMVAECWEDSRQWCNNGDMFDSTMHVETIALIQRVK